jgi:hypothetical protein
LVSGNGFRVLASISHRDELVIDRSPAWTASDRMLQRAVITESELLDSRQEIEGRLRDLGQLRCTLPITAVLAEPASAEGSQLDCRAAAPALAASAGGATQT